MHATTVIHSFENHHQQHLNSIYMFTRTKKFTMKKFTHQSEKRLNRSPSFVTLPSKLKSQWMVHLYIHFPLPRCQRSSYTVAGNRSCVPTSPLCQLNRSPLLCTCLNKSLPDLLFSQILIIYHSIRYFVAVVTSIKM